jgi:ATP-dependent Clp protease ATP-binding subunit ClpB
VAQLRKLIQDRGMGLALTDATTAYLANEGYDPVYGARPLKRAIQRELQDPLALAVLEGRFGEGDTVRVDVRDGKLAFEKLPA